MAAFEFESGARTLKVSGDWTVWTVGAHDEALRALAERTGPGVAVDVAGLERVDLAGAYLIDRTIRGGSPCGNMEAPLDLVGEHATLARLIRTARDAVKACPAPPPRPLGILALFERAGRAVLQARAEALGVLSFLGECLAVLGRIVRRPSRLRLTSVAAIMETAGLDALPIVATLSFFVGLVVAYLGASILGDFGAAVFTVELVGFSVLREFAVVIAAVLLAGRTDSAFTAEIGAMKMRQEVDAMRVLGLDVMERLVAPRLVAMIVMTPLLTLGAMIAGLVGGMVVCWAVLGVSPLLYITRIQEGVGETHFWVGMSKAPIFGFILALVGCRHGLKVGEDVASLGRQTTASVVQSIFLVIVVDALLALWFLEMGW